MCCCVLFHVLLLSIFCCGSSIFSQSSVYLYVICCMAAAGRFGDSKLCVIIIWENILQFQRDFRHISFSCQLPSSFSTICVNEFFGAANFRAWLVKTMTIEKSAAVNWWKWLWTKVTEASVFKLPHKLWIEDKVPLALYPSEGHWRRGCEPETKIKYIIRKSCSMDQFMCDRQVV